MVLPADTAAFYPLQSLSWQEGSPTEALSLVRFGDLRFGPAGQIRLYREAKCSFNAYFSSFYESYWVEHTNIDDVVLELQGSGDLIVSIFRETSGSCNCVLTRDLTLGVDEIVHLTVPLAKGAVTVVGRLFVDIAAGVDHVPEPNGFGRSLRGRGLAPMGSITRLRWMTSRPPERAVELAIGFCTFNREFYLAETLHRIFKHRFSGAPPRIVIVNQGPQFKHERLIDLVMAHRAQCVVVSQGNFGGAGGFARAAIEAMRTPSTTHVVFMDDDILLHPESLENVIHFHEHCREDVLVGAPMFDLRRPNFIYEAGAQLLANGTLRLMHHDKNLQEQRFLSDFVVSEPIDYCGWWFCAIPRSCFEEQGLPAPVFIRGDDLEFGFRCGSKGIRSVSLPGLCVWHEPFYARPPSWQLYYDLRNRLIFTAQYSDSFSSDSADELRWRIIYHLLMSDYQQAWLVIRAVEDFLEGPALLDRTLPGIHKDLMQGLRPYMPRKARRAGDMAPQGRHYPATKLQRLLGIGRMLKAHWFGTLPKGPVRIVWSDQQGIWTSGRLRSYVLADRGQNFHVGFTYDRDTFRSLYRLARAVVARYASESRTAAEQWRTAQPRLIRSEGWERILGLTSVPAAMSESSAMQEVAATVDGV